MAQTEANKNVPTDVEIKDDIGKQIIEESIFLCDVN